MLIDTSIIDSVLAEKAKQDNNSAYKEFKYHTCSQFDLSLTL